VLRLEPIIMELERQENVLVVGHQVSDIHPFDLFCFNFHLFCDRLYFDVCTCSPFMRCGRHVTLLVIVMPTSIIFLRTTYPT
jgi:hypothetical protein